MSSTVAPLPISLSCVAAPASWKFLGFPPESLVTACVALLVGFGTMFIANRQRLIAEQQKEIAKEKVISDLFERRYKIFEIHAKAIIEITMRHTLNPQEIDFLKGELIYLGEQARFLFDDDLNSYLRAMRKDIFQYAVWSNALKEPNSGSHPLLDAAKGETHRKMLQLAEQLNEELVNTLPARFMPYLRIKDFRTDAARTPVGS